MVNFVFSATHSAEYNMTNIFRASDILSTYTTTLKAGEITANIRNEGYIGHIVRHKYTITNLTLTQRMPTA